MLPFSPALPSGECLQICLQSLREPRFLWLSLPTLATKGLPLPREQVPFESSLTSFLCSCLCTRIFHDAILYGVTGKELLKVSSCAWSKPIVLPAQSPSMLLTPAWPRSCCPRTAGERDVLIHREGRGHKQKAQHKEWGRIRHRHGPWSVPPTSSTRLSHGWGLGCDSPDASHFSWGSSQAGAPAKKGYFGEESEKL